MIDRITAGDTFDGTLYITGDTTQIIENGVKYRVDDSEDYTSITYDGVVYERLDIFTGGTETIWEGDGTFSPVLDITGSEFYITVKAEKTDSDANALLIQTLSVISDPTNGAAYFKYQVSDWLAMTPGNAFIETKWKDADDNIKTFDTTKNFIIDPSLLDV
jgi:hypothetical protein